MSAPAPSPVPVTNGHAVTIRYSGPGNVRGARWYVSWPGWEAGETVRRSFGYTKSDRAAVALEAARLYCEWLGKAEGRGIPADVIEPESVAYGNTGRGNMVAVIQTRVRERRA